MLKPDSAAFLQLPVPAPQRTLYPGVILEVGQDGACLGEFSAGSLRIEAGTDLVLCYELGEEFVQQFVRVRSASACGVLVRVGLELLGDPCSAESRLYYRISASGADIRVRLGQERDCPMLDLGLRGFSVRAHTAYQIGQVLDAELQHGGCLFATRVSVRHVRAADGALVYGLLCVEADSECTNTTGLPQIYASLWRRRAPGNSRRTP
jgi:hypothetical protein